MSVWGIMTEIVGRTWWMRAGLGDVLKQVSPFLSFLPLWRWAHEAKRVRARDRARERECRDESRKRGGKHIPLYLGFTGWVTADGGHFSCCIATWFSLLCCFLWHSSPQDVGVLRRPLTVINVTGCPSPTDIWVLLLHHYTSLFIGWVKPTATCLARVHVEG